MFSWLRPVLLILLSISIVGAGLAIVAYIWTFGTWNLSDNQEVWGWFGDYLGGVIGVILAFISLMALLYTIYIQSVELRLSRKEMQASTVAQKEAAEYSRLEAALSLRAHYFELMSMRGKYLEDLRNFEIAHDIEQELGELESKIREINKLITLWHSKVLEDSKY